MAAGNKFPGAFRCQSDAVFMVFDFLGCSDDHAVFSPRQINFEDKNCTIFRVKLFPKIILSMNFFSINSDK